MTNTMPFLGHHLRVRKHPTSGRLVPRVVIPKDRSKRLRMVIKAIFSRFTTRSTLEERLKLLNPVLRGWANFYEHAWGAKRVLRFTDHYVWWTIYRWLRKKQEAPRHSDAGTVQAIRVAQTTRANDAVAGRGNLSLYRSKPARSALLARLAEDPRLCVNIYGEPGA